VIFAHHRDVGGLLSDGEIRRLCNEADLMEDWDERKLRPAGYDVRIAKDGLITPDGDRYKPRSLGGKKTLDKVLWLASGDVAELSSRERFNLPTHIGGNVTIRTELSARGLLLLSGLLIDPGYGPVRDDDDELISDGRLHFFVANFGTDAIALMPGQDSIAAVQFFRVVGDEDSERSTKEAPTIALWDDDRPTHRLGFITNLKELQEHHNRLVDSVRRTEETTRNVLLLGYFLLAATILGLTLNNLLSLGSDPSLVDRVSKAVPDAVSGKLLLVAVFVTAAWVVRSLVALIGIERTPPTPPHRFYHEQACEDLVAGRRRWRLGILFVTGLLAFGIAQLAIVVDFDHEEVAWVALGVAVGCAALFADWWLVKPVDAKAVQKRTDKLKKLNDEPSD
jgi:deoxycytidine triphosphate deaminase